jgi:head-tail adaptor
MNLDNLLDLTCDIVGISQARTTTGGTVDTESTFAASVATSIRQLNGTERLKYGSENKDRLLRFYFKGSQTVLASQKILFNGEYYNVLNVYDVAGKTDLLHVDAIYDPTPITEGSYDT